MNREKRNVPKPKRFCTTSSSNDETLSRRKNRPRIVDTLIKIKKDLRKQIQIGNNLAQKRQTSKIDSMNNFKRKNFKQTSTKDIVNDSRRHSSETDMTDDSGHVSRSDPLDDPPGHTSSMSTTRIGATRQHVTRIRSSSNLQTTSLNINQRNNANSSLKRQLPQIQTPISCFKEAKTATIQLQKS